MSDAQDGCEWVNVSSGPQLSSPTQRAVKWLCAYVHYITQTMFQAICSGSEVDSLLTVLVKHGRL